MCKSDTMHQQFMDIHFLSIFQYWFFLYVNKNSGENVCQVGVDTVITIWFFSLFDYFFQANQGLKPG